MPIGKIIISEIIYSYMQPKYEVDNRIYFSKGKIE